MAGVLLRAVNDCRGDLAVMLRPWALTLLLHLACAAYADPKRDCQPYQTLAATGQLATGSIVPGGCRLFTVQLEPSCSTDSYLHVEMWGLDGLSTGSSAPLDSYISNRADPLLGLSQNASFSASYLASGTWQVEPADAVFDEKGYELLRHYLSVQQQLRMNTTSAGSTWCASGQFPFMSSSHPRLRVHLCRTYLFK